MNTKNTTNHIKDDLPACCDKTKKSKSDSKIDSSNENPESITNNVQTDSFRVTIGPYPYLIGSAAAIGIIAFYLGLLTLVSDWYNAKAQFNDYRWWIVALSIGFGVQATIFSGLRIRLHGKNMKGTKTSIAASGGMSTASMAACCAHYIVAFLPALGLPFLSAAAAGLAEYQPQFFFLGIVSNLIGIGIMIRLMLKNNIIQKDVLFSRFSFGFLQLMSTHSVELGQDMVAVSLLKDSNGQVYRTEKK